MSTLDIDENRGDGGLPDGATGRIGFTVGGVLRRFTGILRDNFGALFILTVLLAGVLPFAVGFAYSRVVLAIAGAAKLKQLAPFQAAILPVIELPITVLLQGAVAHIGIAQRPGFDLGAPLRAGLRHFLPNLGIVILSFLGIVVGYVLLIVPGVMLTCRWLVAIQAEVAEGTGVLGALRRSSQLTKGYRWGLFGLLLIAVAVSVTLAGAQFLLSRALVGSNLVEPVRIVMTSVIAIVGMLVSQIGAAAAYLELRRDREGGTTTEIASVFD